MQEVRLNILPASLRVQEKLRYLVRHSLRLSRIPKILSPYIHTARVDVRATGTAFNVEAYPKDSMTSVTMVKGRIGMAINQQKRFDLFPGERASFNKNTLQCKIEKTDPYKWYAWKDGLMVFRDDPLEYVFKRVGQT